MLEGLKLMEIIIELKINFPNVFHFLKGNHENILNEEGQGNYPFGKFTSEGAIAKSWFRNFYDEELLYKYSKFEKQLPLFAIGFNFLISHAEPKNSYTRVELIDSLNNSEIIYNLTWTRDHDVNSGSVEEMLKIFSDDVKKQFYFAGHSPIKGLYKLKDNGLVQIHNPNKMVIVLTNIDKDINLDKDIFDLENSGALYG